MSPEQWQTVRELFHAVLDVPADERADYVRLRCEDPGIRAELETLLSAAGLDISPVDGPAHAGARQAIEVALGSDRETTVSVGQVLGHYKVVELIGAGGMGQVYRARDLLLKRDVAVKILPGEFASDPERMARLQCEAEVLASLNHANIAQIYGIEDGALIMELVPGKTLSGPLAPPIAADYAAQMAAALEYAHAKSIVHRDFKPSNVIVTPDGTVKILDFGLALTRQGPAIVFNKTAPDSITASLPGRILGTAAYMSPEQASGRPVDQRTDVWSFGVVLWEMLTGTRLFRGESVAQTLADVLRARIAFNKLPRHTPKPVRNLLSRCLERDPNNRLPDLGAAKLILQQVSAGRASSGTPVRNALTAAAVALIVIAAALRVPVSREPNAFPGLEKWRQLTNFPDSATDPSISPDGRALAFLRGSGGWFLAKDKQLYVKFLPDGPPLELTHDSMAKMSPAFSPDGSRIAYTVGGFHTWVVPVTGNGEPRLLLSNAEGLTWIGPKDILFSEYKEDMGIETALETRESQREIYLPKDGMAHFSSLSPDRKEVLVVEMTGTAPFIPCRVVPFDGSSRGHPVGPAPSVCTAAVWTPNGKWMYFTADGGNGFHIWRQRTSGGAAEQVTSGPIFEQGLAIARNGRWMYTSAGNTHVSVWLQDRNGRRRISGEESVTSTPVISADGSRLYYLSNEQLWSADLSTGRTERALPGIRINFAPQSVMVPFSLSADGKSLAYTTADGSAWIASLDGHTQPEHLPLESAQRPQLGRSGRIYFTKLVHGKKFVFSAVRSGHPPTQLVAEPVDNARISPDEELVAGFSSDWLRAWRISNGVSQVICPAVSPGIRGCFLDWALDGRTALFSFRALGRNAGNTVAVPLKVGAMLPPIPKGGFRNAEQVAALSGAVVIPEEFAAAGPDLRSWAYTQNNNQWNIFQIPLP